MRKTAAGIAVGAVFGAAATSASAAENVKATFIDRLSGPIADAGELMPSQSLCSFSAPAIALAAEAPEPRILRRAAEVMPRATASSCIRSAGPGRGAGRGAALPPSFPIPTIRLSA
ncbi:MAG TPA: hypothetical protein VIM12_18050 [Noviherbaspirillum sp.]|jgi:hypothetical protein|uniref:hypothetical protein n=1 Tax=Noviherbaspirillum sp. TaxID=1926288 RepID=UPI002F9293D1